MRMDETPLTAYWIKSPIPHSPLGFGITAHSRAEALAIIRAMGYGDFLVDDLTALQITEGIVVSDLNEPHVVANMGPIVVRGMWYPFVALGMPAWAEEHV